MRRWLLLAAFAWLPACGSDDSSRNDRPPVADAAAPDARPDAAPADAACVPAAEICNGFDDDCDGRIDEEVPSEPCGMDVGACHAGMTACRDGLPVCEGAVDPVPETCNGQDDDCDGTVDDDPTDAGGACGDGACGIAACRDGALACEPMAPQPETCNGRDDDCDGQIDEDVPGVGDACGSATGLCRPGVQACVDGMLVCMGGVPPRDETCDGQDEDCDGSVDETPAGVGEPCGEPPSCHDGVQACRQGHLVCEGATQAAAEVCNGRDDDCDGQVDESDPMLGQACGDAIGACMPGEIRCIAGQPVCFGGVTATPEICNGQDDDCDGQTDENDDVHGGACPRVGEACVDDDRCATGLCLNDGGQRYCSRECAGADDRSCGFGLTCAHLGGRDVCAVIYPNCLSDRDCVGGDRCEMIPGGPQGLRFECRPPLAGGLPVGDACAHDNAQCANAMCLAGVDRCTALCARTADCGAGLTCARSPVVTADGHTFDVGFCLQSCGGDVDCGPPGDRVCLYNEVDDGTSTGGYCDAPYMGAPTGSDCASAADCDHGWCRRDARGGYCTNGCAADANCPDGWTCDVTQIRTPDGDVLPIHLCRRPG
jgi:hypothetical protein